jgi:hypothetical protein
MKLVSKWENKFTLSSDIFLTRAEILSENHRVLRMRRIKTSHRPLNFFAKVLNEKKVWNRIGHALVENQLLKKNMITNC